MQILTYIPEIRSSWPYVYFYEHNLYNLYIKKPTLLSKCSESLVFLKFIRLLILSCFSEPIHHSDDHWSSLMAWNPTLITFSGSLNWKIGNSLASSRWWGHERCIMVCLFFFSDFIFLAAVFGPNYSLSVLRIIC